MTYDGSHSYTYDAEGRQLTVDGTAATYLYNAQGQRVEVTLGGTPNDYIFDAGGRAVTEVSPNGWNWSELYAGGMHVATYSQGTTYFDHSDWLGTVRQHSNMSGVGVESCTSLSFGDSLNCTGSVGTVSLLQFTGDQHDYESNLEHTLFRQLSTTEGRWLMPDPAGMAADPSNPQSWNEYAYVGNNPMNLIDPSGLCSTSDGFYTEWSAPDCTMSAHNDANPNASPSINAPPPCVSDAGCAGNMGGPGHDTAATLAAAADRIASQPVFYESGDPNGEARYVNDVVNHPHGPGWQSAPGGCLVQVDTYRSWCPYQENGLLIAANNEPQTQGQKWPYKGPSSCSVYGSGGPLNFVCKNAGTTRYANSARGCLQTYWDANTGSYSMTPGGPGAPNKPFLPLPSLITFTESHAVCLVGAFVY